MAQPSTLTRGMGLQANYLLDLLQTRLIKSLGYQCMRRSVSNPEEAWQPG